MRAADRVTRRGRAAAASAEARGTLRRNDAGALVPLDAAAEPAPSAAEGPTTAEARQVRQIDNQGWAR